MDIQPIGERVVLKQKKEEKTAGGIYIPESANEKKQGIVHAVGTDKDGKPLPLQKGDTVLYGGYSNEEIELGNDTFVVVEFKDIVAKLTK
jgi:chaperonin GroES